MAKLSNVETLALIVGGTTEAVNSLDTARIACIADWAQEKALKAAEGDASAKASLWEIVGVMEVKGVSKQGPVMVAVKLIEHTADQNTSRESVAAICDILHLETKAAALYESTREVSDEELHQAATEAALEESKYAVGVEGEILIVDKGEGNVEKMSWPVARSLPHPDITAEHVVLFTDEQIDMLIEAYHQKMERAALVSSLGMVQRKMHGMFRSLEIPVGDHFNNLKETRKSDSIEKAAEFAFQLLNKLNELFRSSKKKLDVNDVSVANDELPLIDQYLKTLWVLATNWSITNNARPYPVNGFSQEELAQIKVPMPAGKVAAQKEENVSKGTIPSAVQSKPTEEKAVVIARPETPAETNKQEPKVAQKEEKMGKKQEKSKEIEVVTPQLVEAIGNMPAAHQQQIRLNIVLHIKEVLGTELMGGKEVFGWKELKKSWEATSEQDRTKVLSTIGSTDEVRAKILDVSKVEISKDDNTQGPTAVQEEQNVNETNKEETPVESNNEEPKAAQEVEEMEIVEETKRPVMPEGTVEVKAGETETEGSKAEKPGVVKKTTDAVKGAAKAAKEKAALAYKASMNFVAAAFVAADRAVSRGVGPASRYSEIEKKAAAMAVDSYSESELALPKSPVGAFLKSLFEKIARVDSIEGERGVIESELKHNKAESIALMMLIALRFGASLPKGERHITKKIAAYIAEDKNLSPMAKKVKNDKSYLKLHTQYLQGDPEALKALEQLDIHRVEMANEQIAAFAVMLSNQTIDGNNKLSGTKNPEVLNRKALTLFVHLSEGVRDLSTAMQRRLATISKPKQLKIGGFERTKKVLWVVYDSAAMLGLWIVTPAFAVMGLLKAAYYGIKSLFKKGDEKDEAKISARRAMSDAWVCGTGFVMAPIWALKDAASWIGSFFKKGDKKVKEDDKAFGPKTEAEANADKGIVTKTVDVIKTHKAEIAGMVAGGTLGGLIMGGVAAVATTAIVGGAVVYGVKRLIGWWKNRKPAAKTAESAAVEAVAAAAVAA